MDAMDYMKMIDKERNIYEVAELLHQNRKPILEYIDILQDPITGQSLTLENNLLCAGSNQYKTDSKIANFTNHDLNSKEWNRLNKQFLNYHKSLTVYTLINSTPIINYLSLKTGIGELKNIKVLDVGGGTGHTHCSFFQYPETIEYYLLDPNLRLLHDQFIRLYPKLTYLQMAHILGQAESLPIQDNSFDLVMSLSSIDHLNDYKKFIREAFRVLKPGCLFFVSSHLDQSVGSSDRTRTVNKIFSPSFWERVSRYLFYRKYKVGTDDHTLHLKDEKPIEKELISAGFKIEKQEVFKTNFYFVARKL